MIPEVRGAEEETAFAITTPMQDIFAPPVSLPAIVPQGIPSVLAPSSSTAQNRPMVTPRAPISTQSEVGNATLNEYVEQTIAMMRGAPHEPPIEWSCTVTPIIPI